MQDFEFVKRPSRYGASDLPPISNTSSVRAWIPMARDSWARSAAESMMRTCSPCASNAAAILSPAGPAPTTSASNFVLIYRIGFVCPWLTGLHSLNTLGPLHLSLRDKNEPQASSSSSCLTASLLHPVNGSRFGMPRERKKSSQASEMLWIVIFWFGLGRLRNVLLLLVRCIR